MYPGLGAPDASGGWAAGANGRFAATWGGVAPRFSASYVRSEALSETRAGSSRSSGRSPGGVSGLVLNPGSGRRAAAHAGAQAV